LFTQCSKCETVFRLSAEVLRAAGGQVRCGRCGEVFNALAHLAEDPSAFTAGETEIDLEFRADSILESPAPMTPPSRSEASSEDISPPPGVEIARLQILDWNENASADVPLEIEDVPSEHVPSEHVPSEHVSSEHVGETSLEFSLPPGELDRIFVESKKRAAPKAPQQTEPIAVVAAPLPPHPEDIEIFNAAAPQPAPEPTPEPASEPASEPTSAPASAPAASGFDVSEDVRREMLSILESSPDIEAPLPVQRRARPPRRRASPFALTPQLSDRAFVPWLVAVIASALLLIVQIVHQNREWLAAHTPLGGPLRAANLTAYQLRQWGVTGDPAGEGTLRVRASILNTAAQLEPYPLLRVTLANRFGGSIGTRDFEPFEYLGKPIAKLLAPGERVDATMDILDPGKSAEGFEIDVCLRGADKKISCANDAAPAQAKR
jgi:predicted Zn finger-like uncharacterized protein